LILFQIKKLETPYIIDLKCNEEFYNEIGKEITTNINIPFADYNKYSVLFD